MKTPDDIMQKHHIKIVRLKEDKPMLYNSIRKSMDDFADQYAKHVIEINLCTGKPSEFYKNTIADLKETNQVINLLVDWVNS